ncbi:MAG: hypothetical protein WDL87_05630 [Candidatus Omnitrophota bacterium]|jgi:hypothetical protein
MQKILSKREKAILYCTIGIVSLSVFYNFIITPVIRKISLLNIEIHSTKTKLKKYLQLLSQKQALQTKYTSLSASGPVSGAKENSTLITLSEIENMANTANIRILDIRPQLRKEEGSYEEILIELRTEGALNDYVKFIYNLENSLLLIRIKRFQFTSRTNSALLEANFSISKLSID